MITAFAKNLKDFATWEIRGQRTFGPSTAYIEKRYRRSHNLKGNLFAKEIDISGHALLQSS